MKNLRILKRNKRLEQRKTKILMVGSLKTFTEHTIETTISILRNKLKIKYVQKILKLVPSNSLTNSKFALMFHVLKIHKT